MDISGTFNDPAFMGACDRVVVMEEGEIVANGAYKSVLKSIHARKLRPCSTYPASAGQCTCHRKRSKSLDTFILRAPLASLYRWILGIVVALLFILFLPWQQNINGKGYVTALTPQDRPQNLQNAVAGQIRQWHVKEGDYVKKGGTFNHRKSKTTTLTHRF
ncbi:MAG: biotin/lipoyl-binding protein [Spirosomataceae bacterium]